MSDWNLVETSWGELHLIPDQDLPRHEMTRHCWCKPWRDGGSESKYWIHSDPPKRARSTAAVAGALFLVEGSGIPGDG